MDQDFDSSPENVFQEIENLIDNLIKNQKDFFLARFSIKNLKRYQAIYGAEKQREAVSRTHDLLKSNLKKNNQIYRTSFDRFLVFFYHRDQPKSPAETRVRKIYYNLRNNLVLNEDFKLVITYSIFFPVEDFGSGSELLALL